MACTRRCELGIVGLDCRRIDDDRSLTKVLARMSDGNLDAEFAQAPYIGALGCVRALDAIAEIVHHLRDAAHADAANADEMQGTNLEGKAAHVRS